MKLDLAEVDLCVLLVWVSFGCKKMQHVEATL